MAEVCICTNFLSEFPAAPRCKGLLLAVLLPSGLVITPHTVPVKQVLPPPPGGLGAPGSEDGSPRKPLASKSSQDAGREKLLLFALPLTEAVKVARAAVEGINNL